MGPPGNLVDGRIHKEEKRESDVRKLSIYG